MDAVAVEEVRPAPELYQALEKGNILLFRRAPWDIPKEDQEFLRSIRQTDRAYHKNIAYRPKSDRVTGFDKRAVSDPAKLHSALRNFSRAALAFLNQLLPRYIERCRVDYASFRPVEEEGRTLSFNKRNDLLHIDAFPTRPTDGDLILRTFVNIHPSLPRVWMTSDPFESVAHQYAEAAGWSSMASSGRLKRLLTRRSAYDRFMLHFHDYLKRNDDYQRTSRKYRWEFPPGAAWIVFTDIVPHAVLSGQYALEQTVIASRQSLLAPECAPAEILKKLAPRHRSGNSTAAAG
jgi:hypothetical protein